MSLLVEYLLYPVYLVFLNFCDLSIIHFDFLYFIKLKIIYIRFTIFNLTLKIHYFFTAASIEQLHSFVVHIYAWKKMKRIAIHVSFFLFLRKKLVDQ